MDINGLFNPENRFWSFMDKIMDLCFVSILWLLFSLPVVTAGASTASLFQYMLKMTVNEEGYAAKSFLRGFKENFLQATALWLAILFCGGFLAADLYFCQFLTIPRPVRLTLFFVLLSFLFVFLLTTIYIFPFIAFFKVTIKKAVTHSFVMSVGNLHVSVTILVIYGIAGVVTYFIPLLFMVWFVLAGYASSHLYRGVFEKYMTEEKEEDR